MSLLATPVQLARFAPPIVPEILRCVVVALVEVLYAIVKLVIVDVALFKRMPPERTASPETERLVEEALVERKLVAKRLVVVAEVEVERIMVKFVMVEEALLARSPPAKTASSDTYKLVVVALVEVASVKTAVKGMVAPIDVLLIVPPLIVKPSATLASVMQDVQVRVRPVDKTVAPATDSPPESEREVPWKLVAKRFWKEEEAVVEVAVTVPVRRLPMVEVERTAV